MFSFSAAKHNNPTTIFALSFSAAFCFALLLWPERCEQTPQRFALDTEKERKKNEVGYTPSKIINKNILGTKTNNKMVKIVMYSVE